MSLGQRIKECREAMGWTKVRLAEELSRVSGKKVQRASVSQWEVDEHVPRAENVIALAKVFKKSASYFERFGGADTASKPSDAERHLIPLLAWSDLRHLLAGGKMLKAALKKQPRHLDVDKSIPAHAFAVIIQDLSMGDRFMPGEEVVIDPHVQPRDNRDDPDFVLARVVNTGQVVFREYCARGTKAFDLVGYHKDCTTISMTTDNPVELLGTMIEHRRKRRSA